MFMGGTDLALRMIVTVRTSSTRGARLGTRAGTCTAENEPCEVRKFELSEMLNLNFEISKLLFATQITFNVWPRQPPDQLEDVVVSTAESRR